MSRGGQAERILVGAFADLLPPPRKTLRDLLNEHAVADRNWSPAIDGLTHEIADEIRVLLKEQHGLTDKHLSTLKEAL